MAISKKLGLAGVGSSLILATALLIGGSAGAAQVPLKAQPAAGRNVVGTAVSVAAGANGIASVTCPAGTLVTGGGGQTSAFKIFFTDSYRSGNGWVIRGTNTNTVAESIYPVAVCAGVS